MDRKVIEEKVLEIVANLLDREKEDLNLTDSFTQDLSADSLTIIEIMTECEEEFQLTINDEETENIKTIDDAIGYIHNQLGS